MNSTPPEADPEVLAVVAPPSRPRRFRWAAILLAVTALVALVSVSLRPREATYETAAVARGDLEVHVEATGTLETEESVEVGSEVSGRVVSVEADFNDHVRAGQVLARMDPDQLTAAVSQARAQVTAAEAAVVQAEATRVEARAAAARAESEAESGLISRQDLEARRASDARSIAAADSAVASARVARANLKAARDKLAKAVIVSPVDGVVLARHVSVGQTVTAGFETPVLFEVARDLSRMRLVVDVDEADVAQVAEGQEASFTVDALPGKILPSRVLQLRFAPRTTENVVTYEAVLSVDNSDGRLRPGMTATAHILVARRPGVLIVPQEALEFAPEGGSAPPGAHVWTLTDGQPTPVDVDLGLTDGERAEVRAGLDEGATVILREHREDS